MTLEIGQKAPDFKLPTDDGKTLSLKDLRGKNVVLYFYPKDDTSGCTKEACSFRDFKSEFAKKNAVILGVSRDDQRSHAKFKTKYKLPFTLLVDEETSLSKSYGVYKKKSMYGREYMGIERTTFVIDAEGRIRKIFPKVKVDGHTDEVLAAL